MIDEKVLELYANCSPLKRHYSYEYENGRKMEYITGEKGEPYVCLTMGPNKVIIRSGYWLYFTIKSDSIFQKRSKLSRIYDFRTQFHCRCRCRQPKWIFRSKRTPFPIPNRNVCLLSAQRRFIRKM